MRNKLGEKGDIKIKRGFLILPKVINRELRWLEKATWMVERLDDYYWPRKWIAVKWED